MLEVSAVLRVPCVISGKIRFVKQHRLELFLNKFNMDCTSPLNSNPHGICVFDHEGDGFPDILVTGFFGCWLYSNQKNKQFRRIDPETLGIDQETFYSSAASGDFNADGIADLFLATYVDWSAENNPPCTVQGQLDICPPGQFEGLPDQVYLGTKSGRFRSANNNFQPNLTGKGLGVIAADFDLDGDTDVYVANDTTPNALYENNENEGFTEVGLLSGVSIGLSGLADGSMGVDSADVDMDGLPDLWVANYEDESFALYRNMRKLIFQNVSLPMKIGLLRRKYVGFGTAFLDINFDGYEDIFCTNGHVLLAPKGAPRRQKALLLHNEKGKYFVDVASSSGRYFSESHTGRGAAVADLDGDGEISSEEKKAAKVKLENAKDKEPGSKAPQKVSPKPLLAR